MWKSFLNAYILKWVWAQVRAELSYVIAQDLLFASWTGSSPCFTFPSLQKSEFHLTVYCCRTSSGLCNTVLRFISS